MPHDADCPKDDAEEEVTHNRKCCCTVVCHNLYFLCGSRSCEVKFLMNQSVSSNPPFFLRLLSPFVCSCGLIKGSRIGFAKFFRRNTTPLRVWRFPRNPLGLETLPFQFAFYLCHRNNQTSGERGQKRCVRETDSHIRATPVPPSPRRTYSWAD